MPELPEVETIVATLSQKLQGEKIIDVICSEKKMRVHATIDFQKILLNKTICNVQRRAKYILISLDKTVLVFHLGMSGRLLLSNEPPVFNIHNHCIIRFESGLYLVFYDPRRFGFYTTIPNDELATHPQFIKLGIEPLTSTFNGVILQNIMVNSCKKIKNILMDAKYVVGIGNIYASEILFQARISPCRPANTILTEEYQILATSIKDILQQALDNRGSTLRDYRDSSNQRGSFQNHFLVYGRENQACTICGDIIKNLIINGRSSYYCSNCQK